MLTSGMVGGLVSGECVLRECADCPDTAIQQGEFSYADPDERFELLIDIFVDGLARLAEAG
ncbi:MAG: hypothetical protein WBH47_00995 [Streptosporangiaceae bacterium]